MSTSRKRTKFKLLAVTAVVMMFVSAIPIIDQVEEDDAAQYSVNAYAEGNFYALDGSLSTYTEPTQIMSNVPVKQIIFGQQNMGPLCLYANGDLYHRGGGLTNHSDWTKIASNVKEAKIGAYSSNILYLTNDNKLYAMGSNNYAVGNIGCSTSTAKLVASNVVSFDMGNHYSSFYVTSSGDLYGTGENSEYQQGSGNTTDVTSYTKRASNVSKVVCSKGSYDATLYITKSGDLYGAGHRDNFGTNDEIKTFTKLASNVRDAYVDNGNTWYISTSNVLYGVGYYGDGTLGTGVTSGKTSVFVQCATNVSKLITRQEWRADGNSVLYIATNGDLYGTGQMGSPPTHPQVLGRSSGTATWVKIASNVRDAHIGSGAFYITNSNQLYGAGYINYYESYYEEDDYWSTGYTRYQTAFKLLASNVDSVFPSSTGSIDCRYVYTQYISANVSITSADTNKGTVSASSASIFVGGNPTISGNKVTLGSTTITATPKAATAQYTFSFSSWQYKNGSSWVSLTNSVALTSGMQIRAVFAATMNNYTVTYYDHNNAKITSYTESIPYNGTITHTTYTVSGKVFCGWYTNSSHTTSFSTSTKITANTNLYAYMVDVLAFTSSPVANATLTYSSEMGSVLFDALGSESAARYVWDFGDGSYGNEPVMYHHYDEPGTYDVLLSVYNYDGDVDAKSYVVAIYDSEVGLEREDNTLLIAGIFAAVILAGFVVFRPF